jgi:mRNA interferase YafQ
MKRVLLSTNVFTNAAKKAVKKDARVADELKIALELLTEDMYNSRLKTHKLKGNLKGSMACSIGYQLRLIFKIVRYQEKEAILLETIGTHDEVY